MSKENANKKIGEIDGIYFAGQGLNEDTLNLLDSAIALASEILESEPVKSVIVSMALNSSVQTVNAMFSVNGPRCNLDSPPEDIELKVSGSGNLVYRCYHDPVHEWDLSGKKI